MFWIGLSVLFFMLVIIGLFSNESDMLGTCIVLLIISILFLVIPLYSGITDYPKLQGEYKSILLMRERVNDIRNSYYKSDNKNAIITGSIENVKQSTTLSEAIKSLTEKETEYIAYRETVLFAKNSWIYKIFLDGLFISDKVNSLPELKATPYSWEYK